MMKRKLRILLRYTAALLVALSIHGPMAWLFLMSVSAAADLTRVPLGGCRVSGTSAATPVCCRCSPVSPARCFSPPCATACWLPLGRRWCRCCWRCPPPSASRATRTRRLAVRRARHLYGAAGGLRAAALFYSRTFRAAEYPQRAGAGLLFADYAVSHGW